MRHVVGVDVGTASVRAGVFDLAGRLADSASLPITRFQPAPSFAQQSSAEIWRAVGGAIRQATATARVSPGEVAGLGFDATCSLVVEGAADRPVSVSPDGALDQDVVMWLDHRAADDADAINATGAPQLDYVGGRISPEMQMPKLRWLKRELPASWAAARAFWDLPDWLVSRATGTAQRSLCSTVCKWAYIGQNGRRGEGWDPAFLAHIGLDDLQTDDFARIGRSFLAAGQKAGGLTTQAAAELGLRPGTAVASGLIDAYAGALGTLGASPEAGPMTKRMAVIAGTSTCHIAVTPEPAFVPGVWGPYHSVLLPDHWALEGGQSAAGALVDAVIARHAATAEASARAAREGRSVYEVLAAALAAQGGETALLTAGRHVQPDFHGNRAPLADPTRRGAISGLSLEAGIEDLALDYLATLQALAYGTRHVLEEMRARGVPIELMVVSGGLAKNRLFLREMADATGCRVVVPAQPEPVLLGAAMLGAVAAGAHPDLETAMTVMSGGSELMMPRGGAIAAFHARKYRVFRRMQDDFAAYAALMA